MDVLTYFTLDMQIFCEKRRSQFHFVTLLTIHCFEALGDKLIVGVHSDAEITKHKGPPVMKEHERSAFTLHVAHPRRGTDTRLYVHVNGLIKW